MVSLPSSSLLLNERKKPWQSHRPGFFCERPSDQVCPHCNRPLMKIDHYGQMLIGCIDCNRGGHPGDTKPLMELLPDDLEALRAMLPDFDCLFVTMLQSPVRIAA